MTAPQLNAHLEQRLADGEALPSAALLNLYDDPEADLTNVIARWMESKGVPVYGVRYDYARHDTWLKSEAREDDSQSRADFLIRTETCWGIKFGKKSFGEAVMVEPPLHRATHRWLNSAWISTVDVN